MLYAGSKGRCGPMTPGRGLAGLWGAVPKLLGEMPGPVMGPPPHSGKRTHLGLPLQGGPSLTLTCVGCGRGQTWPLPPQSLLFSSGLRCRLWGLKMRGVWYRVWVLHPC